MIEPMEAVAAPVGSAEQRIFELEKSQWIRYPLAMSILEELNALLAHPPSHRMPNMALIGDSNNGKSALLNRFASIHNPQEIPENESVTYPVLVIQCPASMTESRLYTELLSKLFSPGSHRESPEAKFSRLKQLVRQLSIKMIVLDEFHHAFSGPQKMRGVLNTVKYMCNELQIPFVLSGTPEMLGVLQSDPQLANRFPPRYLPKWEMGKEYRSLLATFEQRLGLARASDLHQKDIAAAILRESDGLLGDMIDLLNKLAVRAIKSGAEQITLEMLERANLEAIFWTPPSLRGHYRPNF